MQGISCCCLKTVPLELLLSQFDLCKLFQLSILFWVLVLWFVVIIFGQCSQCICQLLWHLLLPVFCKLAHSSLETLEHISGLVHREPWNTSQVLDTWRTYSCWNKGTEQNKVPHGSESNSLHMSISLLLLSLSPPILSSLSLSLSLFLLLALDRLVLYSDNMFSVSRWVIRECGSFEFSSGSANLLCPGVAFFCTQQFPPQSLPVKQKEQGVPHT